MLLSLRGSQPGCLRGLLVARRLASPVVSRPLAPAPPRAGADALSRYIDWRDRATCILFGDGCGAVVLRAREDDSCGLLGMDMHSGGAGSHTPAIGGFRWRACARVQRHRQARMCGAVQRMATGCASFISKHVHVCVHMRQRRGCQRGGQREEAGPSSLPPCNLSCAHRQLPCVSPGCATATPPAADGNGMRHLNCAFSGEGMKPLSNGHASNEVSNACMLGRRARP